MKACLTLLVMCVLASGCSEEIAQLEPVEEVIEGPIKLEVAVTGEVRAAKATPMNVPGERFSQRRATWLLGDGEPVKIASELAESTPRVLEPPKRSNHSPKKVYPVVTDVSEDDILG